MKKEYLFGVLIILVVALLLIFKSPLLEEKQITQINQEKENDPVQGKGLGSLCPDETSCRAFCQTNRGQCEQFCYGKTNELCAIIFPPESDARAPSIPNNKKTCISNPSPLFTHHFTDIAKISDISQYGNNALVNPGSQARSYVSVKKGESTPVYAPVNATITKLVYSNKFYPGLTRPEYRIDMQVSCEVHIAFDHIVTVVDKLKEQAPAVPANKSSEGALVKISVQAGELLGYTSGTYRPDDGGTFDFLLLNTARSHVHRNPARWQSDHSKYKDCPYDYFTNDLKQQYFPLIKEEKGTRSCGPRVREIPNTPAGYWFQENATESSGSRAVIYESSSFVEWTIIKNESPPLLFRDTNGGRVPLENVIEGKSTCYFDKDRNVYLYLKMLQNDQLSLSTGSGPCPSSFPEDKAEIWER